MDFLLLALCLECLSEDMELSWEERLFLLLLCVGECEGRLMRGWFSFI